MMGKSGFSGVAWAFAGLFLTQFMAARCLAVVDVLIDEQKLSRAEAANGARLGSSVAIEGDYLVAGAAYDNYMGSEAGSAQVFFYNGSAWQVIQKLTASDAAEGDRFGNSVSVAGEVLVVGAPMEDNAGSSSGAAYVFRRDGDSWVEEAKLTASDGAEGDYFGNCVSTDGNRIIVGAHRDDDDGGSSGSAYVFVWNGGSWVREQKLTASDGAIMDYFGYSVAVDGTRAIVGAYGDDDNGINSGSAYIFNWNGSNWVEGQKLAASDAGRYRFGYSVSIHGDRASASSGEAVYIFSCSGSVWIEEAKLVPSEGTTSDLFGTSLSMDGENVIVGARGADDRGTDSGAVYVFSFNGTHWLEAARFLADDGTEADSFGISVAIDEGRFVAAASGDDNTNGEDAGSVYTYVLQAGQWSCQAKLTAQALAAGDNFGNSICVDGDTAIIGAYKDKENGSQSGAAYVFEWNGSQWLEAAKLTAADGAAGDFFGGSVSLSEGRAIVAAWGDDDRGSYSGSAYIFAWNGSSWVQQAKLTASDGAAGDCFGCCVSIHGDRAIIGTLCDDDKGTDSGSAYIFRWNGSSWVQEAKLTASDGTTSDEFGLSVSIDADTVIIGAPDSYNGYLIERGAAYVFVRNGTSWTQQARLKVAEGGAHSFGRSVSISGDKAVIGGDAYSPAYIFARTGSTWTQRAKLLGSDDDPGLGAVCIDGNVVLASNDASMPNAIYAFVQRGASWVEVDKISDPDATSWDRFGWALSISGNRCLVGAPWNAENGTEAGAAYAYTWCSPGDLNGDCKVDMEDVAILGLHWLDGK